MQSDRKEVDDRWPTSLRNEVKATVVELEATLVETEITVGELLSMKPGDVIPIDLPRAVSACVDGVPVFTGQFGVSRGNNALKVLERVAPKN